MRVNAVLYAISIIWLGLLAAVCADDGVIGTANARQALDTRPRLRFENGKFKVVQITDLHLGEGLASNAATMQVRRLW